MMKTSEFAYKSILTVLTLLIVFAAFTLMLYSGESAVRTSTMDLRAFVEFQSAAEDGTIDPKSPSYRADYSPAPVYRAKADASGSRVVFRIPFNAQDIGHDQAFFLGATPGLQEIRLNGTILQPNLPLDTLRGAADGRTSYYMLPARALRADENLIEIFVDTQSSVVTLAPFSIGPATDAAQAANATELITETLPIVSVSILVFAALLCLVVNWPAEDRRRVRSLVGLMAIWALRSYFISFQTPVEVPFLVTRLIYYLFEISLLMAFALHLLAGENIRPAWSKLLAGLWGLLVVYLLAVTSAGFLIGAEIRQWFKYLAVALAILSGVFAPIGLISLAWAAATRRDGRWLERISLMICLIALTVDAADSSLPLHVPFHPELTLTFYTAVAAGIVLGLGVVASIAREASEARRTVVQANETLAARLAEQDAELARSYEAQKQMLQRQVVLEERQRIVRDMHDGIGGQLLGLMMQVRGGASEPRVIEEGLQSSISDLRLIVDSMDTAEEGLAETLRSFEHRVRTQVEAAGIKFVVTHGLDEAQPGPGPRPTLQILRILQEAVTNSMRHSGASEIVLHSGYSETGQIVLSVRDNGKGLPTQIKGGRGLASMRSRAETVGGNLTLSGDGGGTTIVLTLPQPSADQ